MFALDQEARLSGLYPAVWSTLALGRDYDERAEIAAQYLRARGLTADEAVEEAVILVPISLWREHRVIYRVDDTLGQELAEQARAIEEDEQLPGDLLMSLPYPCISIEGPGLQLIARDEATGAVACQQDLTGRMLVTTASDAFSGIPGITLQALVELTGGQLATYVLPIRATLRESLDALRAWWQVVSPDLWASGTESDAYFEALPVLYAAQLILYLQAVNADIQRRPSRAPARKQGQPAQKAAREFSVGVRVGATIRRYDAQQASGAMRSGSGATGPHRPHTRRGHWHHYWTGPRDGERKLILKWIAPMLVGGDASESTTVVPVKGQKGAKK